MIKKNFSWERFGDTNSLFFRGETKYAVKMAIHFTFIASFVMPRKISYQHQWEEMKNSHLGVSITSIVITSNDLFVMCSIAQK